MAETWLLLDSGPGAPADNMAWDEALLLAVARLERPVLRCYGWTGPAATFGYFQRYADVASWTSLRPLIRRPTGGGLVPHDADWTYSLVFPATHPWHALKATQSYRRVHEWLAAAFATFGEVTSLAECCVEEAPGQCFAGAEKNDLLWRGAKIAGAAQRRTRAGLLIQGSVQPPPVSFIRTAWQKAMCDAAHAQWGACWEEIKLDAPLNEQAFELARLKYSQPGYNQKR